ncbi:MAG: hypothetical protein GY822_12665 [Deltaproteobacteria bacterium]|nr:hypothetical protein [Deltaproteobacteria bacterium]
MALFNTCFGPSTCDDVPDSMPREIFFDARAGVSFIFSVSTSSRPPAMWALDVFGQWSWRGLCLFYVANGAKPVTGFDDVETQSLLRMLQ